MSFSFCGKMICTILFTCCVTLVSAQSFDLTEPTAVYAPTTNVASLAKVADVPVSFYTGTPQIGFPMYSIRSKRLQHNISLSYTSGGIQLEEEANWVGLGWNLSIGGAIVRSAVGRNDESSAPQGYDAAASALNMPLYTDANPTNWLGTLTNCIRKDIAEGRYDLSPDLFFVQTDGQSAKMFCDKNGNFFFSPFKAWKVAGNTTNGYVITIENGDRYEFKAVESSTYSTESTESDGSVMLCKSAWFLTRIVSADVKDTITFNYAPLTFTEVGKIAAEARYDLVAGQNASPCGSGSAEQLRQVFTSNSVTSTSHVLTSIVYTGGKVELILAADRDDIDPSANKYRVRELKVYSGNGTLYTLIKRIAFNQSYTNSASGNRLNKRLLLNSFVDYGGTDSPKYNFTYLSPEQLGAKDSYSQDHWGYYNGNSNSTLIPAYDDGAGNSYPGANRETDSVDVLKGMLSSITYPTGGVVTLEYEAHKYSYFNNTSQYSPRHTDSTLVQKSAAASTVGMTGSIVKDTTVFIPPSNTPGQQYTVTWMVAGQILGDAQADVRIENAGHSIVFAAGDSHGATQSSAISLTPGQTYYLIAERVGTTERATINVYYKDWNYFIAPVVFSKFAGGCRIKRITMFDGINHSNDVITRFKYQLNDSISSGILLDYPKYEDISLTPYFCPGQFGGTVKGGDWQYFTRHAGSLIALGRTQGSVIGYSNVTVLHGENGENGREDLTYSIKNLFDEGGNGYPYIPKGSKDDLRGLLLQHKVFTSTGALVKSTTNDYSLNNVAGSPNFKWVWAAKYGIRKSSNGWPNSCPDDANWSFIGGMYKLYQYWPVVKSKTDSVFDITAGGAMVTKVDYEYDSVTLQLSKETSIGSDGLTTVTTYKYPNSFAGTAVFDSMRVRNILIPVIEKIVTKNGVQIYREKNNFGFFGSLLAPSSKEAIGANAPVESRIIYHQYDSYGNLVEQSRTDDTHEVYIWGYNGKYPVARILGSTYNSVISVVNSAVLQWPATDQQLRNELNDIRTLLAGSIAQVHSYTFLPEVGISSETAPAGLSVFYEYDGMLRLKTVKDKDGIILKNVDYRYQKAITE